MSLISTKKFAKARRRRLLARIYAYSIWAAIFVAAVAFICRDGAGYVAPGIRMGTDLKKTNDSK